MTGTARLGMTTPTREEPLMNTTAWPNLPPVEMIAFAYDGWSVLRVGATPHVPLCYEATHPELPGDVLVAHSLGEVRDAIDSTQAAWDALDPYGDYTPDLGCPATRHAGSASDPYAIGCDLPAGHDGAHVVTDPLGPDTGTWTWTRTSRFTLKGA